VSFSHCLASSSKVLADLVGTFKRINDISDHHHSTEKYPLYIDQLPPSNIYISFSLMNSTSCPRAAITSFSDSRLIGLTFSNEWIWSYRLLNWVKLNPNRRWATPLPRVPWFLSLEKSSKPPKLKFVAKPPLKKQYRYRAYNC
jgi:hypothetical protein